MIPENINPGTPNQKDGDKLRDAFVKTITIFTDIYTKLFTTTSELTNNGADGVNPFITALDLGDRGQIIPIDVAGVTSYSLRNVNRSLNHIAIGSNAMDLIKQDSMAQVGIGGEAGFGFGYDLFSAAGSFGSTIFGYNNQILGGQLGTVFGQNNIINTGYADLLVGVENVVTSPLGYTFTTGRNNLQAGRYSASLGVGLINRGYGTVIGTANLDDKGSTINTSGNNPLFIVGNGSLSNDQFNVAVVRSDAFVIYQDGRVIAPSLTNALINTNVKSLVNKEYVDVIEAKVDTNTAKHIEGTPDNITFNTAATPVADVEGLLQWNTTEDTLDLSANGVTYQLGQEISPLVRNSTGSTIANGTPVMFAGTLGASSRVLITPAIADNTIPSSYILGTTTEDILNGADGHVTWFGKVRGIDTTGTPYGETWADQDILYVSPTTAGYLTNVKPSAPNAQIFIGVVISAHATTGSYFIRPSWRGGITDLDDVNGTPLTTDGQILVWDNTNQYFDPTVNILTIQSTANSALQPTGDGSLLTGIVTGELQKITEGPNTGYTLKGSDRSVNRVQIGPDAIDISISNAFGGPYGGSGSRSFTTGALNINSGTFGIVHGNDNTNTGASSLVTGNRNRNNNSAQYCMLAGFTNINSGDVSAMFGSTNTNTADTSFVSGQNCSNSGETAFVTGLQSIGRSEGEFSCGRYNTDYTSLNDETDRIFSVGNGVAFNNRSDAFSIFKNGAYKFFTATLASVTNAVSGFFMLDENARPNVHDGTQWNALDYVKTSSTVTANAVLTEYDSIVIIDALSNTVTLTLPSVLSVEVDKKYTFTAYDETNIITINTNGVEEIRQVKSDAITSLLITSGQNYTIVNTGVYWQIIQKS